MEWPPEKAAQANKELTQGLIQVAKALGRL